MVNAVVDTRWRHYRVGFRPYFSGGLGLIRAKRVTRRTRLKIEHMSSGGIWAEAPSPSSPTALVSRGPPLPQTVLRPGLTTRSISIFTISTLAGDSGPHNPLVNTKFTKRSRGHDDDSPPTHRPRTSDRDFLRDLRPLRGLRVYGFLNQLRVSGSGVSPTMGALLSSCFSRCAGACRVRQRRRRLTSICRNRAATD